MPKYRYKRLSKNDWKSGLLINLVNFLALLLDPEHMKIGGFKEPELPIDNTGSTMWCVGSDTICNPYLA
jgi:hypothetical protein